jgi:hypothetical protein
MKKPFSFLIIFILSATLFTRCEKKGDPPVLPPLATMKIDFSDFTSRKKSAEIIGIENQTYGISNANFVYASSVAGFWNTLLALNLVIPVASFTESFNQSPVYLENKTWQWSYSVNVLAGSYKARLIGQIRDNDVKWEMYISKEGVGAFSELLWFSGTSALDGNSGQWILNCSVAYPEPMLQIDWTQENDVIGSIKYTYIRAQKDDRTTDPYKGSYIQYGLQNTSFNAYYNVRLYGLSDLSSYADVFIEWNTPTHNGHVKSNSHYNDSNWHCWNEVGSDIVCN